MNLRRLSLVAALVVVTAGCGGGKARVKGQVVDNGQPVTFPPTSASVELAPIGEDGQADVNKAFTCVVNEDGTFELLASGGELPPGKYRISLEFAGGRGPAKAMAFSSRGRPLQRELKAGENVVTIDLSTPES